MREYFNILLLLLISLSGIQCQETTKRNDAVQSDLTVSNTYPVKIINLYQDSLGNAISTDSIYYLYNLDNTLYCTIKSDKNGDPICNALDGKIISYYPSWYILTLFCKEYNDHYLEVRVGSSWKLLNRNSTYCVSSIRDFLLKLWYTPLEGDTLYTTYRKKIPVRESGISYRIVDTRNDWIKLKLENSARVYWIKWKDGWKVYPNRLMYE